MTLDLPNIRAGQKPTDISARHWQNLVSAARQVLGLRVVWPLVKRQTRDTLAIRLHESAERAIAQAGSAIVRLTFVGHNWDILICEDSEGKRFNVAKPPLLQPSRNMRQGEIAYEYTSSIERTAREDVTGVVELQEVVPMYLEKHETQNPFGHDVFAVAMSEEEIGPLKDVDGTMIEGVTLQELPSSRAWSATQRTVG
jgi:hypothetical protein